MNLNVKISWKCIITILLPQYLLIQFTNKVAALIIQAKSPCDNTELNGFEGTITSPNYPSPYPSEIECEWKIRSPPNSAVRITVLDLDITEDEDCPKSPCCSQHHLTISREGGSILLCGNQTVERTITVFQPLTFIKYFSSSGNGQGHGFKIVYTIEPNTCKPNEFQCVNRRCYPASVYCNGYDDCGDGSDEMYCLHTTHIRYNVMRKKKLEHENHLMDDQELCKEGSVKCPLSTDHCYFPRTDVCDGKFDCPKGEDEVGCVPECPNQISCSSGDGCYLPMQRCNSIRNCRDNSDETGCPSEPCIAMQFTCLNGACISGSAICDGDDDCGDFSDEENCTKSSFMKAAVVGLLSCIMLFCIVLGCMYHVYTARLRASANFVHQLEPEPSDDDFIYREPPPAYSVAVNDPRIITYPTAEITERFFDNDPAMRFQGTRNVRRSRRRQPPSGGGLESSSNVQTRPRGSGSYSNLRNGTGLRTDTRDEPKTEEMGKTHERASRSDFQRHLEFCGFVRSPQSNERILPTNSCRNESPCSSPSLSPSRESITSCTSLEEMEDLVSLFHR